MLSIRCYFQYYISGTDLNHPVTFAFKLDGRETTPAVTEVPILSEFGWSRIFYDSEFTWGSNPYSGHIAYFIPNSSNRTITFQLYDIGYESTAHVKDINILLEVMDGLPPS